MAKIVIVGVGNIASAFVKGFIKGDGLAQHELVLVGRNAKRNAELSREWDLPAHPLDKALDGADVLIVGVKPYDVQSVLSEIPASLKTLPIIVSFASGLAIADIQSYVSSKDYPQPRVVRAMPNTPMEVGKGVIGTSYGEHVSDQDSDLVREVLGYTASIVEVTEKQQPALTAIAGSGPAYVYLIAEALADAGVAQGLPRHIASTLAADTIVGAGVALQGNPDQAATLRAKVTSPAGTTAAAVRELEAANVRSAFYNAIAAAAAKAGNTLA